MGKPFIHITTKTVTQREGNPFLVSYQSDLVSRNYEFKNLVFASGSVEVLFYVWAMRVLEKLGILPASAHALSKVYFWYSVWALMNFKKHSTNTYSTYLSMIKLSTMHDYLETFTETYVWSPGAKLLKCFSRLLESKSFDSDLTVRQLDTILT